MQEKENSPSQPYQNSMSIHEMEAEKGEPSQKKEVKKGIEKKLKEVFRSKIGAKSESNGAKTGEKQGKNRGKTGVCEISQPLRNRHFVAKPFRNTVEVSAKIFAAAKPILAHECHFAAQEPHFAVAKAAANHQSMKSSISQPKLHSVEDFAAAKPILAHECHFAVQEHLFRSCETHCEVVKPDFAPKVPFRRVFRNCEAGFGTRVPLRSTVTLISQLRNGCEVPKREKSQFHSRTPILAIVGHISITSRSSNYACNISFERLGSHESTASNGARFGFETEKL
ncbi:hypothetical protein CK203_115678 [Vitis vinifera]|uniref:Uncharacterized protein n=1 Tax=Vitis vinifera TaxID=29760 RepID=A0A438CPL0_VITVI|nr:hypothetical protein CK203_115678 [Vitis vinifera]